jgi:hypothetical protein
VWQRTEYVCTDVRTSYSISPVRCTCISLSTELVAFIDPSIVGDVVSDGHSGACLLAARGLRSLLAC